MSHLVEDWLLQSFVLFLLAGSLAGLATGIALIFFPQRLRSLSAVLNRWISTRHLDGSLERAISADPWFYRYRRVSASFILLGVCYILYFFTVELDMANVVAGIAKQFAIPQQMAIGLLDALVLTSLTGAILAAFVGVFLLLRPSMLRDFEQHANRWVSLRQAMKPMETERRALDEYVCNNNRRAGMLMIAGSLYVLVLLVTWIGR